MNLTSLYIGATIFGAGVLLVDLFGLFSSVGEDGDDAGAVSEDSGDGDADAGDGDSGSDGGSSESEGAVVMHSKKSSKFKILAVMSVLRSLVYFALGFGAVGWFAVATGKGLLISLLWSVPSGVVITIIAKLVKRLQRQELDSQFKSYELLMEKAEVLVAIPKGQIGKVRIVIDGMNIDRYAKAQKTEEEFKKGEQVQVVEVSEDFLYVEQAL